MGYCRKGHNDAKPIQTMKISLNSQKGVALFQVILISLIVLLSIGGLYSFLTRSFKITTEYKTFTTVREAAISGANYAASVSSIESRLLPTDAASSTNCTKFNIDFRIYGRQELGNTEVTVCRIRMGHEPGAGSSGVGYDPQSGALSSMKIGLKIVSVARFPATNPHQEARIEALYYR